MKQMRWAGIVLLGGMALAAGCQQKVQVPQGPVYPPPMPVTAESKQQLERLAPDALIGNVVAVVPESFLAAVSGILVAQIKVGDVVTFIGGEAAPVDVGVVKAIVNDTLHVSYAEPRSAAARPWLSHMAIRFRQPLK